MPPARPRAPRARAAGLALLALAGVLGAGVEAQNFNPQADLETLAFAPPQLRVNQSADLAATVRNNGPNDLLGFGVVFGFTNATQPLTSDSTVSWPGPEASFTDETNETGVPDAECLTLASGLKKGCSVTVHYLWTPPLDRRGPANLSATAQVGGAYGDPKGTNNAVALALFIAHHQLALALEPKDDRGKVVRTGDAAFYRLAVRNDGNVADNVSLALQSPDWQIGSSLSTRRVTLLPGEAARIVALLEAPPGDGSTAKANVTANNTAAPDLGSARRALPTTTSNPVLSTTLAFRVEAGPDAFAAAGGITDSPLPVRNLGTGEDALRWSITAAPPAEWNVALPEPVQGLEVGNEQQRGVLRIVGNAILMAGASAPLGLRAVSVNTGATEDLNITLRIAAPDLVLARLTLDRAALYQGDAVLLTAEVENRGKVPMPKPARLAAEAVQGATRVGIGDVLFSGLGPGEARGLTVRWDTGSLSGAFEVAVRIDPDDDLAETLEDNNNATHQVVVRTHGLEVRAPPPREARPGDRLDFAGEGGFAVRNLGNAPEEVLVAFTTEHGWVQEAQRLRLAPAEQANLSIGFQVPLSPGTLREAVRATASLVNRTATRAEALGNITVVDREAPLLERFDAPDFVELGQTATFVARLRDAVGVRTATLHLRMPDGSVREEALAARDAFNWTATSVMPRAGVVGFWVRAVDATPQNNTLDTSGSPGALLVGVRSSPLVELLEPRNHSAVRTGTPLRFRITDVHGIGEVQVRIGARTFDLASPFVLATQGLPEGTHLVEVVARNRFGNPTTATFTLTFDDTPPRVQDGRVEPSRPQPGQEFRLEARASQDAALAAVQVRRDGVQLREVPAVVGLGEVTANLSIAEPGRYVLGVLVEDAAGNAATLDVPLEVGGSTPGFDALLLALAGMALAARRRRP